MKKIIFFMACLTVLLSCKKSSYVANFDKLPQERAGAQIAEVSQLLSSAENGWIASLPTAAGGGYGFYFSFDADQNVKMYGDLTDQSASVVGKSYYRLKQDMGTDLVFDTYNYISMLNDPDAKVMGGLQKIGYSSDIEFIYDRSSGDSVVFIGKKFRQELKMVKASAAQRAVFENGGYKVAIDKFKAFFVTNQNPYIELGSGAEIQKVGLSPEMSNVLETGKRVKFVSAATSGNAVSVQQKFNFTLSGISILNGGLVFQGITFVRMDWKDANTLAVYDNTGKEYVIKNSLAPLIPLNQLLGSKFTGMLSEFKTIYPGTSAKGATILNYFYDNIAVTSISGYIFNYGRVNLGWNAVNKRLTVIGHTSQSNGATTWPTTSTYSYTVDPNGVFKFTLISPPASGYAIKLIDKFHQFILTNSVTIEYYISGNTVYGKMTSVDDPAIVMTFLLQ